MSAEQIDNYQKFFDLLPKPELAYRAALRWLESEPENSLAKRCLGQALLKLGQREDGRKVLEECLQLRPNDDFVHYLIGGSWIDDGEPDQAQPHAERARELDPECPWNLHLCNRVAWRQGRTEEACEFAEQAFSKRPDSAWFAVQVAIALGRLEKPTPEQEELRLSMCRQSLELDPTDAFTLNLYGDLLFNQERYREAIDPYRSAVLGAPDVEAYFDDLVDAVRCGRRVRRFIEQGMERILEGFSRFMDRLDRFKFFSAL